MSTLIIYNTAITMYVKHTLFYQQKVWFSTLTFQNDTLAFIMALNSNG